MIRLNIPKVTTELTALQEQIFAELTRLENIGEHMIDGEHSNEYEQLVSAAHRLRQTREHLRAARN